MLPSAAAPPFGFLPRRQNGGGCRRRRRQRFEGIEKGRGREEWGRASVHKKYGGKGKEGGKEKRMGGWNRGEKRHNEICVPERADFFSIFLLYPFDFNCLFPQNESGIKDFLFETSFPERKEVTLRYPRLDHSHHLPTPMTPWCYGHMKEFFSYCTRPQS